MLSGNLSKEKSCDSRPGSSLYFKGYFGQRIDIRSERKSGLHCRLTFPRNVEKIVERTKYEH